MLEERVEFFSEGFRLAGIFRHPENQAEPMPAIVQGPGWLGLADAKAYEPWHTALVDAGYAVLAFDYRGWGDSEGDRGWILPLRQVEDIINAVTYLHSRRDIDLRRIGAYGMGGIGGGNAIVAAAIDTRIGCVATQSVVADGYQWLRRMRREYEWVEYLERVDEDRLKWVTEGESTLVDPRKEIVVSTPEREGYSGKADVDARMETRFHLQSAAAIMRYRPVDYVGLVAPRGLLVTSVENDSVTPEDHAIRLFEKAGNPKRLIRQTGTSHYAAYTENYKTLSGAIVTWFNKHLTNHRNSKLEIRDE